MKSPQEMMSLIRLALRSHQRTPHANDSDTDTGSTAKPQSRIQTWKATMQRYVIGNVWLFKRNKVSDVADGKVVTKQSWVGKLFRKRRPAPQTEDTNVSLDFRRELSLATSTVSASDGAGRMSIAYSADVSSDGKFPLKIDLDATSEPRFRSELVASSTYLDLESKMSKVSKVEVALQSIYILITASCTALIISPKTFKVFALGKAFPSVIDGAKFLSDGVVVPSQGT